MVTPPAPSTTPPPPPYSARITRVPPRNAGYNAAFQVANDTTASNGPQHDYAAHEQACLRISTIQATQAEPSMTVSAHHDDLIAPVDPGFSGSSYFARRSPRVKRPSSIVGHRLVVAPNARPDDLPFPQPEHTWRARDVTEVDWTTFTNHLVPQGLARRASEEKVKRKRIEVSPTTETSSTKKGPSAGQSGNDGKGKARPEEPASPAASGRESEAERSERISQAVNEWNEAFFYPRGLRIEAEVLSYSSDLIARRAESVAHRKLHASPVSEARPGTSSPPTPRDAYTGSEEVQTWQLGGSGVPSSVSADGTFHPATLRPGEVSYLGTDDVSEAGSRVPTACNSEPQTPTTLYQPTSVAPSEAMSARQLRIPSGLLSDDLDEEQLKELRAAFAKFLLSSRSKEETATALKELNQELHSQRRQTAKSLKAEMKARKKEIKVVTRQHKADLRAEKQKLKAAEKSQKDELKALKVSQKDLEKRQKLARKEAKVFRKNGRKAAKQKQVDSAPYKGWLEALELNQQDSRGSERTE